jgi:hypothetical protein
MVFDPSEFEAQRFDCSWIMLALGNLAKKQRYLEQSNSINDPVNNKITSFTMPNSNMAI